METLVSQAIHLDFFVKFPHSFYCRKFGSSFSSCVLSFSSRSMPQLSNFQINSCHCHCLRPLYSLLTPAPFLLLKIMPLKSGCIWTLVCP